jgi:hypothetical protein
METRAEVKAEVRRQKAEGWMLSALPSHRDPAISQDSMTFLLPSAFCLLPFQHET